MAEKASSKSTSMEWPWDSGTLDLWPMTLKNKSVAENSFKVYSAGIGFSLTSYEASVLTYDPISTSTIFFYFTYEEHMTHLSLQLVIVYCWFFFFWWNRLLFSVVLLLSIPVYVSGKTAILKNVFKTTVGSSLGMHWVCPSMESLQFPIFFLRMHSNLFHTHSCVSRNISLLHEATSMDSLSVFLILTLLGLYSTNYPHPPTPHGTSYSFLTTVFTENTQRTSLSFRETTQKG